MPRRTLWLIFAVSVVSLACYERAERNPYGRWFAEVLQMVDNYYVEPVDDQKLFEGALDGMVGRLDEYSNFLPRSEAPRLREEIDQLYGGIGIEVGVEGPDKHLTVMSPLAGTPAYKAGVLAGDKIVAIDGHSTENLALKEIVRMLRGKPGDEVALAVRRAGHDAPLTFHLVRAQIKTESVLGDSRGADGAWNFFLPGDDRIGYVRISSFGKSTVGEFTAALDWLRQRKCRGLIIDMRNNPGGLLEAAEQICDMFIPEGAAIVSTRGRDAREYRKIDASGKGIYQDLPLVVLVNDRAASASEIVAACLQDHHRATVVGERTWGKGTVQNVLPVEGGKSSLKLTIASYWRPSGKNIHRFSTSKETDDWGVKPDPGYTVKLDEQQAMRMLEKRRQRDFRASTTSDDARSGAEESPVEFDPQLARAVQALRERIESNKGK